MLDLNSSLFWIFFMISVLYFVLSRIFFKPIEKVINEREAKIAAADRRLQQLAEQVQSHTLALEAQMEDARRDAQRIQEEWSRKGEDLRAKALSEAKESAARLMAEKMGELQREVAAAEKALEKEIIVFSEKIRQAYL